MELERQRNPYMMSSYPGPIRTTQIISPPSSVEPNLAVDASVSPNAARINRGTSIEGGSNSAYTINKSKDISSMDVQDSLHDFVGFEYYHTPQYDVDNIHSWEAQRSGFLRDSDGSSGHDAPLISAVALPVRLHHPEHSGTTPEEATHRQLSSPIPQSGPSITQYNGRNTDNITDTVGAIAVDCYGNIAAASSSGGIGMKHRGRVGPAALVGVGTAVIPVDPEDPDRISVATVTSGTGEHMATTMAASTCASRIYYSQMKGDGGILEEVTEDEAMKAMIEKEFMGKTELR